MIPIGPVIDLASLDAALQHLAMLQSRIAEVRATAEATRQRANAYEAAETEADLEEISGITALVEPFAREQAKRQEEAGGRKEIRVPFGRCKVREQGPEIVREDEAALAEWARGAGFMRTFLPPAPVVDWAAIKRNASVRGDRLVFPDGEIVPGVVVTDRPDAVTIEGT